MKLATGLVAALLCCGLASAFTAVIQAGTRAVTGGTSVVNSALDSADSLTSGVPMMGSALGAVRTGTNMAGSAASTSLAVVDTATTIAGYVHWMMTNPYTFWILSMITRVLAFYRWLRSS